MRIGLISDTHGYLPDAVIPHFQGVDAILHAGDVGSQAVLDMLSGIAPVYAVQGNNDEKLGGLGLPTHVDVTLGGLSFHIVHQIAHARPTAGTQVLVYGHSHIPEWHANESGVLVINPGAAGRVGFHKLQTVAILDLSSTEPAVEMIELGPRSTRVIVRRQ